MLTFNPPITVSVPQTFSSVRHQWNDLPDSKTLMVSWAGLPRPLVVFQGANYTIDWTEESATAQIQTLAAAGAIAALYAPATPSLAPVTHPAPTPAPAPAPSA